MIPRPFNPQFGSNKVNVLGVGGTAIVTVPSDNMALLVYNSGAGDLYVAAYSSQALAYVASAKDYPVPAGQSKVIFIGLNDKVSVFSGAGTTAQVMSGNDGVV